MVGGATVEIRVLDGCVGSLHGLLREWDVAARDGVQVRLGGNLRLDHGNLRLVDGNQFEDRTVAILSSERRMYTALFGFTPSP